MTVEHIENSIAKAIKGDSNLTESELAVGGFSTPTIRMLVNNICNLENGTYLEVGLWMGGTFIASFNKGLTSIGIENYAQDFGVVGVKDHLEKNIADHKHKAKDIQLHFEDCFAMDKSVLPDGIDIFCYDGEHSFENQARALPYFFDKLADRFIYLCDDFNWERVYLGTNKALADLSDKIEIEYCKVLRGYSLQDDPIFHNGIAIYLISKK